MKSAVLTALAIGDALGQQFETKRWNDPVVLAWDGVSYGRSDWHKLEPGQFTDDTGMAMALAKSLIETDGQYDPALTAQRYLEWSKGEYFRGAGKTTRLALSNLDAGVPWWRSGIYDALGNGTAMRAAPLGIVGIKVNNAGVSMKTAAKLDAMITHNTHDCQQASIGVASAVSWLLSGTIKKNELLDYLLKEIEPGRTLNSLHMMKNHGIIFETLTGCKDMEQLINAQLSIGVGYTAPQTLARAVYCFMATESFGQAMEVCIRGAGDSDTTAAICGALCGAYYGLKGIDKCYLEQLECREMLLEMDERLIG